MLKSFLKLLLIFLLISSASAAKLMRIAVVEFQPSGVPKNLAKDITDLLHTELVNSGYFTVIERDRMKAILEEHAFQLSGTVETKDAVKLGKLLGAEKLLTGRLMKIGKKYVINARIIDIEKGEAEFAQKVEASSEGDLVSKTSELAKKLTSRILGIPVEQDEMIPPAIPPDEEREYSVKISIVKELKKKDLINCVQINENGNLFAVGFANGKAEIYSLRNLSLMKTINFKIELKSLYFDEKSIYGVGSDKNIKIYDLSSGNIKLLLTKHRNTINSVAVSPDRKYMVTGGEDWSINVFKRSRPYLKKNEHKSAINRIQFSSDNKYLVSVDNNKKIIIWSPPYFKKLKEITGHKDRIIALDISPDGQQFITGSYDKKIKLWHLKAYKLVGEYTLHTDTVSALDFYNNDLFFSGSFDGTIKLWQVRRFREVSLDSDYFQLESIEAKCGYIKDIKISTARNYLIACGNKAIKIWKLDIKVEK